jgi:hypothetical protein
MPSRQKGSDRTLDAARCKVSSKTGSIMSEQCDMRSQGEQYEKGEQLDV